MVTPMVAVEVTNKLIVRQILSGARLQLPRPNPYRTNHLVDIRGDELLVFTIV